MQKQETEKQFEKLIKENELLIFKVCGVYANADGDRKDLFQEIVIQLWKLIQNLNEIRNLALECVELLSILQLNGLIYNF